MLMETENNPAHTDVNFCFPVQYFDKKYIEYLFFKEKNQSCRYFCVTTTSLSMHMYTL